MGRRRVGVALTCSVGAVVAAGPHPARAVVTFGPNASVEYEHYSNVFNLPNTPQYQVIGGGRSEETVQYTAGIKVDYATGPDTIDLTVTGRHIDYAHFGYLSHNELVAGFDLKWLLGPVIDVDLGYTFNRSMLPFANTLTTQLVINTDKQAQATMHFLVTPVWRLGVTPVVHDQQTPLPAIPLVGQKEAFPDFRLHETSGKLALDYLGVAHVTTGLAFTYLKGDYSGIADATKYQQTTAQLTATYRVSELSNFDGALGYSARDTQRNPAGSVPAAPDQVAGYLFNSIGKAGAVTGNLGYNRVLSEKTSFSLHGFRNVDSFVAGANATLGTGVQLGGIWKPDFRFEVTSNLLLEQENFVGTTRTDKFGFVEGSVNYFFTPTITLGPTLHWEKRSSTFEGANYTSWTAAVTFAVKLP
jgi:hypothetical protein